MRDAARRIYISISVMCALTTAACAAPLKDEEKDVLVYGAFIMLGVAVYMIGGKLLNKLAGKKEKEKEEE